MTGAEDPVGKKEEGKAIIRTQYGQCYFKGCMELTGNTDLGVGVFTWDFLKEAATRSSLECIIFRMPMKCQAVEGFFQTS